MILLMEKVNEAKETDCVLAYMRNLENSRTSKFIRSFDYEIKDQRIKRRFRSC